MSTKIGSQHEQSLEENTGGRTNISASIFNHNINDLRAGTPG